MKLMLDTNIFNKMLKGNIDLSSLIGAHEFYATSIQLKEIENTTDEIIRQKLFKIFHNTAKENAPITCFISDVSRVDIDLVGDGKLAQDFKEHLDTLNRKKANSKRNNNLFDAFIAESAEIHNLILATNDTELFKFVSKRGGAVVNFYFLEQLMKNSLECSVTPT